MQFHRFNPYLGFGIGLEGEGVDRFLGRSTTWSSPWAPWSSWDTWDSWVSCWDSLRGDTDFLIAGLGGVGVGGASTTWALLVLAS